MKAIVKIKKEVTLTTMEVVAEVRYWEDTEVNGAEDAESGDNIPCKEGNLWCPVIDIETGTITNWEKGKTADVHYKVCDCCSWTIKSDEGCVSNVEGDYVPEILYPKGHGYGDYIIMDIDENGVIRDWDKSKIFDLLDCDED
jgi:hypothetical protein